MFCPNCGANAPENTAFCPNCGTALTAPQQPVQPQQPVYQQPQGYAPGQGYVPPRQGYVPPQQGYMPPQGYAPQQAYASQPDSGLTVAAKVFMIISTVTMGLYLIPLAWCIPMTVSYFKKVKYNQPISTGFKVCCLLFVNTLAGIFMLCDKTH